MVIDVHRVLLVVLSVSVLLLAGCAEDNAVQQTVVRSLPAQFRLEGEARGRDSKGLEADCSLSLMFELRSETGRSEYLVEYRGVHGGEAFRRILSEDGSGFSFFADVFGEVEASVQPLTGYLSIRIPVNETAEGRFWQFMSGFEGMVDANGVGSGKWTCAPLDIDQGGYVDNSVIAYGTWSMQPILSGH